MILLIIRSFMQKKSIKKKKKTIKKIEHLLSNNASFQEQIESQSDFSSFVKNTFQRIFNLTIASLKIFFWIFENKLFRQEIKKLKKSLKDLQLEKKSLYDLKKLQKYFEGKIATTIHVKKRIIYTKMLSEIKKIQLQKRNPSLSDIVLQKILILSELDIGSAVLLNKRNSWFWGFLLKNISKLGINLTHVLVITGKTDTQITFSHSTGNKFSHKWKTWIETQIDLLNYLKNTPAEIIILQPPKKNKMKLEKRIQDIYNDENLGYDNTDALFWLIEIPKKQLKKFNCWSYATYLLGLSDPQNKLSVPNNRLYDKRLTPSYVFSSAKDDLID